MFEKIILKRESSEYTYMCIFVERIFDGKASYKTEIDIYLYLQNLNVANLPFRDLYRIFYQIYENKINFY